MVADRWGWHRCGRWTLDRRLDCPFRQWERAPEDDDNPEPSGLPFIPIPGRRVTPVIDKPEVGEVPEPVQVPVVPPFQWPLPGLPVPPVVPPQIPLPNFPGRRGPGPGPTREPFHEPPDPRQIPLPNPGQPVLPGVMVKVYQGNRGVIDDFPDDGPKIPVSAPQLAPAGFIVRSVPVWLPNMEGDRSPIPVPVTRGVSGNKPQLPQYRGYYEEAAMGETSIGRAWSRALPPSTQRSIDNVTGYRRELALGIAAAAAVAAVVLYRGGGGGLHFPSIWDPHRALRLP